MHQLDQYFKDVITNGLPFVYVHVLSILVEKPCKLGLACQLHV